jgi:calcineurin-like phosphoesterase family protein
MTTAKTFFTSDLHFFHSNIIKYCDRPYEDAIEMNENIISNWDSTIGEFDHVYILGDVSFGKATETLEILKRLPGIKYLIYGNHDRVIRDNKILRDQFAEVHEFLERDFKVGDKKYKIVMCHYAMKVWNKSHHGSMQLYGHSHGSMPDDGTRSMDVGLDSNNHYPVSIEEVIEKIGNRPLIVKDHHDADNQRD